MEVHGVDLMQAAYRVSFDQDGRTIRGLVPESMISDWLRRSGRPAHRDAYEYIAAHRKQIQTALAALDRGEAGGRAPFDQLALDERP